MPLIIIQRILPLLSHFRRVTAQSGWLNTSPVRFLCHFFSFFPFLLHSARTLCSFPGGRSFSPAPLCASRFFLPRRQPVATRQPASQPASIPDPARVFIMSGEISDIFLFVFQRKKKHEPGCSREKRVCFFYPRRAVRNLVW